METTTIILLSVLSTLSVVAIITVVAVSFGRLNRKVDKLEEQVYLYINNERTNVETRLNDICGEYRGEFEKVRGTIDSRCDKLDSKIKNSNFESQKQVLQG